MEYETEMQNKKWGSGLHKTPKPSKKIFIHGLIIMVSLVIAQMLLDTFQNSLFLYMPPIGFALFLITMYIIQPIILGVLNIILLQRLYKYAGWQIGMWISGLFLLLIFSSINLLIQTITDIRFSIGVGILEIFLLSYPFGYIAKFSNLTQKQQQN